MPHTHTLDRPIRASWQKIKGLCLYSFFRDTWRFCSTSWMGVGLVAGWIFFLEGRVKRKRRQDLGYRHQKRQVAMNFLIFSKAGPPTGSLTGNMTFPSVLQEENRDVKYMKIYCKNSTSRERGGTPARGRCRVVEDGFGTLRAGGHRGVQGQNLWV